MKTWILAIRPKTLIASLSPVLTGTVVASAFYPGVFILTLLFALLIQIGTNLANDYFDFKKGADTDARKGPIRVTQQGLIAPKIVKRAFIFSFAMAALVSLPLIAKGGSIFFLLMILSILFGLLYTAGPFPLAYLGLGDVFVLLFFGPVATLGTAYLQNEPVTLPLFFAGLVPGLLSCAILTINNLRDEDEDRKANKKTLVVRLGSAFGKVEYLFCFFFAILLPFYFSKNIFQLLLCVLPLTSSFFLFKDLLSDKPDYEKLLPKTALILLLYTLCFAMSCA